MHEPLSASPGCSRRRRAGWNKVERLLRVVSEVEVIESQDFGEFWASGGKQVFFVE
jgi:hypothetical protein